MNEMVEWGRESKTVEMYTQGEIRIFGEPLLLRFAFRRLKQVHLNVPNHLNFSSILYFCESGSAQAFLYHSTLGNPVQGQRLERA